MPSGSIPHDKQRQGGNNRHASPQPSFDDLMAARNQPLYGMMPFRANVDERLTDFELRVLSTMCGYANNQTQLCWPKQKTLAHLLHTSVSQISQTIARLVALNYVEIHKFGFPARNAYRIIWENTPVSPENIFPNIGEPENQEGETCLPATEFTVGETQSLPPSKHRVYPPVNSYNIPIEQTKITPSSESSYLSNTLARSAETAPPTVTAPPERRTRERFDSSALKRDPLYIAAASFLPEPVTYDEWRTWATMIGRLHRANVTAADIPQAVAGYRLIYPKAQLTIRALVNHWSEIREGKSREQQQQLAHATRTREIQQRHATEEAEREAAYRDLERRLGLLDG